MDSKVDVLQWNIRGIRSNQEELSLLLHNKPTVICLQETLMNPDKLIHLTGYSCLSCNLSRGTAMYIKTNCLYSPINLITPLEAVAARISFKLVS